MVKRKSEIKLLQYSSTKQHQRRPLERGRNPLREHSDLFSGTNPLLRLEIFVSSGASPALGILAASSIFRDFGRDLFAFTGGNVPESSDLGNQQGPDIGEGVRYRRARSGRLCFQNSLASLQVALG